MARLTFVFIALILSTPSFAFELMLPKGSCELILEKKYYSLCYSNFHRQALWVTHLLTKKSINGRQKRTNNFRRDHHVEDPVGSRDYRGSGFDRGHLIPAADMKLNREAMSSTFYMTNISPQTPSFNQGIWRSLEHGIRSLVRSHGDGYVVTAPVLIGKLDYIASGVSVPHFYYKIIYIPDADIMEAYLLPNIKLSGRKYREFKITVDEVEDLTGLDFFSELPDELEEVLESSL